MVTPDRELDEGIQRRVKELAMLLRAHAGGIELVEVSPQGAVQVRFTGMCTGCHLRPVTMLGAIRPALLAVPGVTAVEAQGSRVSAEAEHRMYTALRMYGSPGVLGSLDCPATPWDEPPSARRDETSH